jgi:transcriptional regulator GlxA family with amidase domain
MEVLMIPGGGGTRSTYLNNTLAFVAETYPKLRYLITVCTGSGLAAKAGILDGRNATTNKAAWATVTGWGPKVHWKAPARWVVDGNIWTTSGVAAGIDGTLAFVRHVYGEANYTWTWKNMEYEPRPIDDDIFSAIWNATSTG